VKGESGHQRSKPIATNEQVRLAQLTLEGKSSDDDPIKIQRLIKKVIDNDNDLAAAVDYILEHEAEVESWTEQKSKKEKKKDEDDRRPSNRGQSSNRGRGLFADRGGRGRSSATSRGTSRGGGAATGGVSDRVKGAQTAVKTVRSQDSVPKPAESDTVDETNDWKTGPMEFKQSADANVPATSSSPPAVSTVPAQISFAAVAANAARKEQMRQHVQAAPVAPAPVEYQFEEPATSVEVEPHVEESFVSEPSVAHPVGDFDQPDEEPVVHIVTESSPKIQANTSWTNQLKSELGIGLSVANDVPIQQSTQYVPVPVQSLAPAPAGVEFATDAVPTGLVDYQFGFVDIPAAPVDIPVAASSHQTPDSMINISRHSSVAPPPQKSLEAERLANGDYTVKASPPSNGPYGNITGRSLGFGDPSSVSYNPSSSDRLQQTSKPPSHMNHSQAQQQQQSHQQPQMQYPPQIPYTSFPYMNMYSPGVRADDPYSAALMQYPFGGMGVDLSAMLPGTTPMSQSGNTQQMQSNQHRSDAHNMEGLKYPSQNSRDQNQQPSNVAPPPGFANPGSFMNQPALSSLFMQQQYAPHPYSFMMPNVGSAGRQMYSQEDERKSYDKMGGAKQAQATPPPHYHNNGSGGYLNIGGMNKKPYNWNN